MTRQLGVLAALALSVSSPADASLILDTSVTSLFNGGTTSSTTVGNDVPMHPETVYFGQLQAVTDGVIDFFYLGNEAGYTNSLQLGGSAVHSTAGLADTFDTLLPLGSLGVAAGTFADFGFCTAGGDAVGAYGGCVSNANTSSLVDQFNHAGLTGYRSIGYRALDWTSNGFTWGAPGSASDLWALFWDDSGASNDDDHDDYVAIARFRSVSVPEPGTALLLGTGLLLLAARRRMGAKARV